jgi:hypothetical protein
VRSSPCVRPPVEALPLTMGLLTRSPIQIKLRIKLAVDAKVKPAGSARAPVRRQRAEPGTELPPNFEPVNVRAYRGQHTNDRCHHDSDQSADSRTC